MHDSTLERAIDFVLDEETKLHRPFFAVRVGFTAADGVGYERDTAVVLVYADTASEAEGIAATAAAEHFSYDEQDAYIAYVKDFDEYRNYELDWDGESPLPDCPVRTKWYRDTLDKFLKLKPGEAVVVFSAT